MMMNGSSDSRAARFLRRRVFLGLGAALLSLALAPAAPAAEPVEGGNRPAILFLGDSLTAGLGLAEPERDAYPALIQAKIDEARLPHRVVNAGVSGDTTAGGVRRIVWVLRQRIDVLVLALGANDGLRGVLPAASQKNLEDIITRVRTANPQVKVVLAGMMMPDNMGQDYTKAFREIFPAVAEKTGAALVPFLLEGVGGRPEMNQGDGIHPNPRGHAVMADTVWKVLRPLL
jgi:acyl-CoA thioesterase-1